MSQTRLVARQDKVSWKVVRRGEVGIGFTRLMTISGCDFYDINWITNYQNYNIS